MSGEDGGDTPKSGKLQNPFAMDREGFLSFNSSTPNRGESRFVPRSGKANRLNNWERFGNFSGTDNRPRPQGRPSDMSPYRVGYNNANTPPTGYYSPRGRGGFQGQHQHHRGSPGNFRGGNFGGGFGGSQRGQFHPQHRQHHQNPQQQFQPHQRNFGGRQSYFHPSMLEDPWSDLMASRKLKSHSTQDKTDEEGESSFNESLIVQTGSSILERSVINPAPDVSDYSSSGEDETTAPSPGGLDDDDMDGSFPSSGKGINNESGSDVLQSSVAAVAGDSILLEQDITAVDDS